MQVLWDLRKTFRCAVLTGSTLDITKVANEIVRLFMAGSRNYQNTVLLLVNDDEPILKNLHHSIITEMTKQEIDAVMPVVILLNCVRSKNEKMRKSIILKKSLLAREQPDFDMKKAELGRRFGDRCKQFHGFNILQSKFSQAYIRNACATLEHIKRTKKPLKTQLTTFLCLLNAYVPGSYLLESQCLKFLSKDSYNGLSLEDQMQPFNHLIITFQQNERSEKKVCMAHNMIAQCCTELLANEGVTRSDTIRNFLRNFFKDPIPKGKGKVNSTEIKQEKFSRLIRDITDEGEGQSVSVLTMASKIFGQSTNFPQALARFYYIKLKDYEQAENWAKSAINRNPQNSFVADTLGQVHKNHLKNNKVTVEQGEILLRAKKAIEAFENAENLAENEDGPDVREHGNTNISSFYNYRVKFWYLMVCNILFERLSRKKKKWEKVLTTEVSMGSVIKPDTKLLKFNDFIVSLRNEVDKRCCFFFKFLTYSKPNMENDDPEYIFGKSKNCYQKFVGNTTTEELIQMFEKRNLDDQSVEVLSFLVKQYTQSECKEISTKCREMQGKMPLTDTDPPELHMLAILLDWPKNIDECDFDLSELSQQMHNSYENAYKKFFRNRYLLPLFFIGKGEGLKRIVHRKIIEKHLKVIEADWSDNWKKEEIFRNPAVQDLLLRLDGEVRNYRVYTRVGGKEIEINANLRNSLWKKSQVTFYLGFTIRGPVAFGIQNKDQVINTTYEM
uniref:Sterile alpha motif domain-containing protein 9-like n=1 Tax=Pundamilia nyererei TaxID=303518 RepID=A0A3B4GW28_9CICH